jgi:hypothetical protein
MLKKAIEKIKAEMDKNKDDDFISSIGEFLIYYLGVTPWVAEKILNPEKSMAKVVPELWKAARAKKKGNGAVLKDNEVIPIVLKYFDIEGTAPAVAPTPMEFVEVPIDKAVQDKNPIAQFNVELDF